MPLPDELKIPIRGASMLPTLREGDVVLVRPARIYLPGQILVFVDLHRQILCHRVMAVVRGPEGWNYRMKGDNAPSLDAPVAANRILGKVTRILRDGREAGPTCWQNVRRWAQSAASCFHGR